MELSVLKFEFFCEFFYEFFRISTKNSETSKQTQFST